MSAACLTRVGGVVGVLVGVVGCRVGALVGGIVGACMHAWANQDTEWPPNPQADRCILLPEHTGDRESRSDDILFLP
jgi:phage tail tape-measure protein